MYVHLVSFEQVSTDTEVDAVRATSTAHLAGPAGMPKGGDTALHPAIPGPERGL